ncbi:MAG: pantoate--beta-alanine ligase [Candidatus Marinimicrobia bacterium]|nr:pantoate--beta-alanine ligase [Candidatus Neomarinimicrobiota bacterium]
MNMITKIDELRKWRNAVSGTVGFVPTMGGLHDGHLSLVKASNDTCDNTVVSIYVNPAQFSPNEDLSNYPRDLQTDIEKLDKYSVDALFFPDDRQMYPNGFSTSVSESQLSSKLEGKSRPTHFAGVTTIVSKLFNLVNPTHAFFGKKDAQQLRVIQKMVTDLNFDINIIPYDIVRETNGLAMSSRNKYLSSEERRRAGILNEALTKARELLGQGERSTEKVKRFISDKILSEPLSKIDYVSIADHMTLDEASDLVQSDVLVSVAIFFAKVRLIDNFEFMIRD